MRTEREQKDRNAEGGDPRRRGAGLSAALSIAVLAGLSFPAIAPAPGGGSTSEYYCSIPNYTLCYSSRTGRYRCYQYSNCGGNSIEPTPYGSGYADDRRRGGTPRITHGVSGEGFVPVAAGTSNPRLAAPSASRTLIAAERAETADASLLVWLAGGAGLLLLMGGGVAVARSRRGD